MEWLAVLFGGLIGAALASAVHCLALRSSARSWATERSICDNCSEALKPITLIPIVSFIIQRGRSSCCDSKLSIGYLGVELLGFLSGAIIIWNAVNGVSVLMSLMSLLILIFALYTVVLDGYRHLISIPITAAAIIVFAAFSALDYSIWNLVVAPSVGLSFFLFQYIVTKGKGIGTGDLWLAVAIGMVVGWPMVIVVILFGYILGSVHAVWLICQKRAHRKTHLPLGAYLAISLLVIDLSRASEYIASLIV